MRKRGNNRVRNEKESYEDTDATSNFGWPKQRTRNKKGTFHGPTGGVYQLTRHPNYTGEVLMWLGVYIAGLSAIPVQVPDWEVLVAFFCSSMGLFGIVSIMRSSTKRLVEKQATKYSGQRGYDDWAKQVPATLVPFTSA